MSNHVGLPAMYNTFRNFTGAVSVTFELELVITHKLEEFNIL